MVDLSTILATHLTEVIKSNLHELLGRQELVHILNNFKESYPKIVDDLIPDILPLGTVLKTVQNLLKEGVSIRDLRTILETLAEHGATIKDTDVLTEVVRRALHRTITEGIKNEEGDVALFTLDRKIEEEISKGIVETEWGRQVSVEPSFIQSVSKAINKSIESATAMGEKMIVLCDPNIRGHFKKLMEHSIPNLIVITHGELSPNVNVRSIGMVSL